MAELTHAQYDALERAVIDGRRVAIRRRGTEYVVIPQGLVMDGGRERIESVHPTTGERITFYIDDLDGIQVIR
ncbi:MAG: hypothetical protein WKG32_11410 [Gemmatimonadaceae bacterium]